MGITVKDIHDLRMEVILQNRTPESICFVITRKTAVHIYTELFSKGLMKEVTFNEDEMCKHMHNSMLFGATIKVKGEP